MAGATFTIDYDDTRIRDALRELEARSDDIAPILGAVREYLDLAHRARFDQGVAPDGTAWAPLSEVTRARKPRRKDEILVRSTLLRDTLRYRVSGNTLEFGTDRPYGAAMQYGMPQGYAGTTKRGAPIPWGDIPARAWLGESDQDRERIVEIVRDELAGAIPRR